MRALLLLSVFIFQSSLNAQENLASFSSFDNTTIIYKDQGNGKAVILLHGFISSGSSWYDTAVNKALVNAGYRVIIPDMRGNGQSDKPQTPIAYQDNAEIKDIIALADHLELNEYMAIGYSRGSIILAELLTQDLRISKAILGGMGLDFSNPNWERRKLFADAFSGRTPLNDITRGAVQYAQSIKADLKILGLLQDFQPATSQDALKKISVQTLVLAGDQDKDNGSPEALKNALGNATLIIVPGDHNTTYRKETFAKAALQFLLKD